MLFELGTVSVGPLLKRHAKARPELQFRILHVLGAMGAANAQRKAARVSLLAEDVKLRRIAFACLMNLEHEAPSELPVLLESCARFKTAASRERIMRYLQVTNRKPIVSLRTVFPKAPPGQREVIASMLSSLGKGSDRMDEVDRFQHTELLVLAARDKAPGVRNAAVQGILGQLHKSSDAATLRTLLAALEDLVSGGVDLPLPVLKQRVQAIATRGPDTARGAAGSLLRALSSRPQQGRRR